MSPSSVVMQLPKFPKSEPPTIILKLKPSTVILKSELPTKDPESKQLIVVLELKYFPVIQSQSNI